MRVDGERRRAEGDIEHDIGGLAPDAGQRFERFAIVGHLAAVIAHQRVRQRDDVFRLVPVKADRLDPLGEPRFAERRHLGRRIGEREQRPRRLVDADVGRLGREDHRDEQGEGVAVFELASGLGASRGEPLEDLGDALARRKRGFVRRPA